MAKRTVESPNRIFSLGIMSGTSLDGVDMVLCQIQRKPFKMTYVGQASSRFPKALRNQIYQAACHKLRVHELALLNYELGRFYAQEVKRHARKQKWALDLVGLHGQTVFHQGGVATLQIGEPSFLAETLGVPVVSDFRAFDIAAGGQGAPLATVFHLAMAKQVVKNKQTFTGKNCGGVAFQNLGGIGNVSYFFSNTAHKLKTDSLDGLPAYGDRHKRILSFDTGPANMLIDMAAQHLSHGTKLFDKNGDWAATGIPDEAVVNKWLKHPFFKQTPPKSCGREEFGEEFFKKALKDLSRAGKQDILATFSELTARSIELSYRRFLPKVPEHIFLCGGGSENAHLRYRIQYFLPESQVLTTNALGWPHQAIEGAAFALLAALRLWQIPSSLHQTTGARRRTCLGKLTLK